MGRLCESMRRLWAQKQSIFSTGSSCKTSSISILRSRGPSNILPCPFVGTLSFHTLSQIYLPNIKQVLLKEHLRQINKQNECLQESRLEVFLVWIFLKGITLTFINNGQTIQLHLYQKGKDLLLGQSKVNKVKIVLPFLKFMKRPQTKFYADTMHHSKVIRSKKGNIYH